jgi:hypothetical protein
MTKKKKLNTNLIAATIAALLFTLAPYHFGTSAADETDQRTQVLSNEMDEVQIKIASARKVKSNITEWTSKQAKLIEQLPADPAVNEAIRQLQGLATSRGIDWQTGAVSPPIAVGSVAAAGPVGAKGTGSGPDAPAAAPGRSAQPTSGGGDDSGATPPVNVNPSPKSASSIEAPGAYTIDITASVSGSVIAVFDYLTALENIGVTGRLYVVKNVVMTVESMTTAEPVTATVTIRSVYNFPKKAAVTTTTTAAPTKA